MKIWTSTEKGDDKIIAYANETLYKANPPDSEIDSCVFNLKTQNIVSKHFFSIPVNYISTMILQEGRNYIEINFRGDSEHVKIKNETARKEVFEYFKSNIPGARYSVVKPTKLQAIKKPLIAMAVITVMFLWTLYLAYGLEAGEQYDISGGHYDSFAGIALALASIGVKKVVLLFVSLFLIAGISLTRKYKARIAKDVLTFRR